MMMYQQRLACLQNNIHAPELVLLHGWGSSAEIWRYCLPSIRRWAHVTLLDLPGLGRSQSENFPDLESIIETLYLQLPRNSVLVGWSLGGMLAAELVLRYPSCYQALITVASNLKYVADKAYEAAIPIAVFEQFYQSTADNPLKSLQRFIAMQVSGDVRQQSLRRLLTAELKVQAETSAENLLAGLRLLRALDHRQAKFLMPSLRCFGDKDSLVPVSSVDYLNECETHIFSDCAHLPFISQSENFWNRVKEFLRSHDLLVTERSDIHINKELMKRSFSRAASHYDNYAKFQRDVAQMLLDRLPVIDGMSGVTLDLGCGTGNITAALQHQLADGDTLLALDISESMLRYARERTTSSFSCINADAESLPIADGSVSLIFSSLAVQWSENLAALYAELFRVLTPGGQVVIATFGPNTLCELREAWAAVDCQEHVNQFSERTQLQSAIDHTGLIVESWEEANLCLRYSMLTELTQQLKGIGAHNVNRNRQKSLTGKGKLQAMTAAYEEKRDEQGLLPASYQTWFIHLKKPFDSVDNTSRKKL